MDAKTTLAHYGTILPLNSSKARIGIGLIGCGSIALESHIPAINQNTSASLLAATDVDPSRARAARDKAGSIQVYEDYKHLLKNLDIDAVDICTPTKYHCEITVAAANSGKHVLCEKPIALTLEEADRMITACAENDVKLMIAHSRRFIPRYSTVKRIIKEGKIGKPISALQISRRPAAEPGSWYFDPSMTYGPIAEVGIHDADLLRWFFDDNVIEVFGTARTRVPTLPLYDQVFASLKFKKGAVGSFEVGYVLPKGYAQYTTLEVMGSQGFISGSDDHMNVVVKGAESGVTYPSAYSDLLTVNSAYEDEVGAFVDSIMNDKAPPVTGKEARAALEIILATLKSIERHEPVTLPL